MPASVMPISSQGSWWRCCLARSSMPRSIAPAGRPARSRRPRRRAWRSRGSSASPSRSPSRSPVSAWQQPSGTPAAGLSAAAARPMSLLPLVDVGEDGRRSSRALGAELVEQRVEEAERSAAPCARRSWLARATPAASQRRRGAGPADRVPAEHFGSTSGPQFGGGAEERVAGERGRRGRRRRAPCGRRPSRRPGPAATRASRREEAGAATTAAEGERRVVPDDLVLDPVLLGQESRLVPPTAVT